MGDPRETWWSIYGDELYLALQRVGAGEHPEIVWLELVAATETETVEES